MPDPISNAGYSNYSVCDPNIASCSDSPPASPVNPTNPTCPTVVTIEPVVITGDAGTQELLRRYDSDVCTAEKQTAELSCSAIALGVLNAVDGARSSAVTTAFHASVICGKDLRALYDCNEQRDALQSSLATAIADCHERDGLVKIGASPTELVCEVPR
jgi:hypothetical protein